MHKLDDKGDKRWVITRPFKIFTKQLADEIVTYADFQTFGRPGIIAARLQLINDAIRLIERFPGPPIGDPKDLEEFKRDLEIISADDVKSKTLKLEDEVRCRRTSQSLHCTPSHRPQHFLVCLIGDVRAVWPRPLPASQFASCVTRISGLLEGFKELNLKEL